MCAGGIWSTVDHRRRGAAGLPAVAMRKFLAPDPARLLIFAVLLLIALMGSLQADGFTDRSGAFLPAIPFWTVWMFMLVPLAALSAQPPVIFWTAQILYFYLLGCLLVEITRGVVRSVRGRR